MPKVLIPMQRLCTDSHIIDKNCFGIIVICNYQKTFHKKLLFLETVAILLLTICGWSILFAYRNMTFGRF